MERIGRYEELMMRRANSFTGRITDSECLEEISLSLALIFDKLDLLYNDLNETIRFDRRTNIT